MTPLTQFCDKMWPYVTFPLYMLFRKSKFKPIRAVGVLLSCLNIPCLLLGVLLIPLIVFIAVCEVIYLDFI